MYLGGLMVMLMSIVLGMGVPGVAAYVIVSTVSVPVLIQAGAIPMAAHMFCLIYACLSNITPPVAMSSYVASGIAGSDQTKTSLIAVKIGLTGFILPFFFLDNPILLLGSTEGVPLLTTLRALLTSSIGVIALSSGLQGYLLRKLNLIERLVMVAAGLLFIETGLVTDLVAILLVGVILTFQYFAEEITTQGENRMKKYGALLLVVTLLVPSLLFAAGAKEGAAQPVKKTVINFPTAATTGAVYPLGSAMANLWNTKLENVRASAQASAGGIANLNMIADGEAQLGVAVTSIMYESFHGIGAFEGRPNPNLRVMIGLYANPNQVVVTQNSGINSLADLSGKRFASGAPGSTTEVETSLHLTTSGVNYPDGLRVQYVGFTEAIDLMRNKQLDGAWIMAGIPNAAVTEMLSTAGGKLLSLDMDLIKKLQQTYPWYGAYTIPAGTYPARQRRADFGNQDHRLHRCTCRCRCCVRHDQDVLGKLRGIESHPGSIEAVNPKEAVKDLAGLPLHEGAARYYREIGLL